MLQISGNYVKQNSTLNTQNKQNNFLKFYYWSLEKRRQIHELYIYFFLFQKTSSNKIVYASESKNNNSTRIGKEMRVELKETQSLATWNFLTRLYFKVKEIFTNSRIGIFIYIYKLDFEKPKKCKLLKV